MSAAAPFNTSETISQDRTDDHIIITLIDPSPYPMFGEAAAQNIVTLKDFNVASGLLVLPPVQNSFEPLSYTVLLELCEHRQLGMVTSPMAREMLQNTTHNCQTSTEAIFENVAMTPDVLEATEDAAQALASSSRDANLNNQSPMGIKTLAVALVQRWAKHVHISGQPDEVKVRRHLSRLMCLQSLTWYHPHVRGPDFVDHPMICHNQICYNIPGLQGFALGRYFGKRVRLSITGLPLAGLARKVALYMTNCVKMELEEVDDNCRHNVNNIARGLHILRSSVAELLCILFVVGEKKPMGEDMTALKQILLAAPHFESLTIVGDPGIHSDGFAGASLPGSKKMKAQTTDGQNNDSTDKVFYLPPFKFEQGERLPPLRRLQLWQYDWRCHSENDVRTHWDFSQLRSLMFDGAPLRWFLGTIDMESLSGLTELRLEDAEWAIHPGEARQAALMLSLLLTHHIGQLERLELIGVYTDNLTIAAIHRHSSTLERLVLRHPYGLGMNIDATTPSAAPLLQMTLRQEQEFYSFSPERAQLREESISRTTLPPVLSRLASLEIDLDERYMEQDDEPHILTRVTRLPMLRSVALAVPSVLTNLNSVPKYDADLHNALGRMLFIINQRQECISEGEYFVGTGQRRCTSGLPSKPLEQIIFYIDGFAPIRGSAHHTNTIQATAAAEDEQERDFWRASRESQPPVPEDVRALVATLAMQMAHNDIAEHSEAVSPSSPLAMRSSAELPSPGVDRQHPPLSPMPTQFFPSSGIMTSALNRGPSVHGLSFLQPGLQTEVDVTPGIVPALTLRSHGLRSQRCIIAELTEGNGVKDSNHFVYHLYEEYTTYDVEDHSYLTSYQCHELWESNVRPRQRLKLPFVIRFAQPADLPAPRWDMLGVPIWG